MPSGLTMITTVTRSLSCFFCQEVHFELQRLIMWRSIMCLLLGISLKKRRERVILKYLVAFEGFWGCQHMVLRMSTWVVIRNNQVGSELHGYLGSGLPEKEHEMLTWSRESGLDFSRNHVSCRPRTLMQTPIPAGWSLLNPKQHWNKIALS